MLVLPGILQSWNVYESCMFAASIKLGQPVKRGAMIWVRGSGI